MKPSLINPSRVVARIGDSSVSEVPTTEVSTEVAGDSDPVGDCLRDDEEADEDEAVGGEILNLGKWRPEVLLNRASSESFPKHGRCYCCHFLCSLKNIIIFVLRGKRISLWS